MEATQGLGIHSQAHRACKFGHNNRRVILKCLISRVEAVPRRSPLLVLQFPEGKSLYDVDWIGVLSRRKKVRYLQILCTIADCVIFKVT